MKSDKTVLMDKLKISEKEAEEFMKTHTPQEVEKICYWEVN